MSFYVVLYAICITNKKHLSHQQCAIFLLIESFFDLHFVLHLSNQSKSLNQINSIKNLLFFLWKLYSYFCHSTSYKQIQWFKRQKCSLWKFVIHGKLKFFKKMEQMIVKPQIVVTIEVLMHIMSFINSLVKLIVMRKLFVTKKPLVKSTALWRPKRMSFSSSSAHQGSSINYVVSKSVIFDPLPGSC